MARGVRAEPDAQLALDKVRPIFLHNDDRLSALLSIVGISLLIFGLIETQPRAALSPEQQLPGL